MLTATIEDINQKANRLLESLRHINDTRLHLQPFELSSKAGGGALPLLELPSQCVGIKIEGISANSLERNLRENDPPIIARIEEDYVIMDLRTILQDEIVIIVSAFENILKRD
jgi:L-seryl-tRNA(Ser) seleniumtransferase